MAEHLEDGGISPKDKVPCVSEDPGAQVYNIKSAALPHFDQMAYSLRKSVESLPTNHRRNIIKLSVIPGSFTLDAARNILDYQKRNIVSIQLDLHTLTYRSLLESEIDEDLYQTSTTGLRYHMDLPLRSFIIRLVEESGGELLQTYADAKKSYLAYYGERLHTITKCLQEDFVDAMEKLDEDRANYEYFFEMLKTTPEEFQNPDTLWWVYIAAELIYYVEDRVKFYSALASEAKSRGDMLSYANNTSLEVLQLLDLGHDPNILLQKLQKVEDIINKQEGKPKDRVKLMSLAYCYYVRGDILSRYQRATEAIPWLEKCVEIRRDVLGGESGNHLLIARALNTLGCAIQQKGSHH